MIRVLLVEDDPVIRDTTCYFLKSQQNFEVVCAETGGDALSHARERFDAVSYTHLTRKNNTRPGTSLSHSGPEKVPGLVHYSNSTF